MKRSAWRYLWTAPDIRRKLLITLMILVIHRFVAHIRVPGVDMAAVDLLFSGGSGSSNFLEIMNLMSGGTVRNFSVLAMGVYPYITAQIILQLLVPIIPAWQAKMEDDPREGRRWMEKNTYYLSVVMAALTAVGQIGAFSQMGGVPVIPGYGFESFESIIFSISIVSMMVAGTMFAIWLGELISEYGIRNQGLSLIIFSGIIASMPGTIGSIISSESPLPGITAYLIITLLTIFVIVFVQQGQRNIPVMYPGRRVGNRMSMPVKGTLPLRVNMAGMIPLIFAQAILSFPAVVGTFFSSSTTPWVINAVEISQRWFGGNSYVYFVLYFVFVVAFTFFYTDVIFSQQNYGENLKRAGAQIPGVSRGVATQRYLSRVLRRITFPGAFFLGVVAILPFLATLIIPALGVQSADSTSFLINASGLLIVVGVVRDTFFNIEAELKVHGYDEALLVK